MDIKINDYIYNQKDKFLKELFELLKIPSVSAQSTHNDDMHKAATWVCSSLKDIGLETRIFSTPGHPIVYGEKIIDKNAKTILFYGHYDVQPAEPFNLWKKDPFEPYIENHYIYARGASDDKGQVFAVIKALETAMALKTLKFNIKIVIEGEEEVGSINLGDFVKENKELLKADLCIVSDGSLTSIDSPTMCVGTRGLLASEIKVTGPNKDLHSGIYGGAVDNPLQVISNMISMLKDKDQRIQIPHFYDDVIELPDSNRKSLYWNDESKIKQYLEISELINEKGYTPSESMAIRPTLEINGLWGGYTGEGGKTIIPSIAQAKITMRLVHNQNWEEIAKNFKSYITNIAPNTVDVEVIIHDGARAYSLSLDNEYYKAIKEKMKQVYQKEPQPTFTGGSIPVLITFEEILGTSVILMDLGSNIDDIHSPNEKFGVKYFLKGIEWISSVISSKM